LSYTPIIYVFDSYYEVWGIGIRYGRGGKEPNRTLIKYCKATVTPFIYICEKRKEVYVELLRRFKTYGVSKVKICRETNCKEIEL
jgi:hypothetical protein